MGCLPFLFGYLIPIPNSPVFIARKAFGTANFVASFRD